MLSSRVVIPNITRGTSGRRLLLAAPSRQLRRRLPANTTSTSTMTRRTYFFNSHHGDAKAGLDDHLRPHFTPLEEFTMDCTAWFVVLAIVWTPTQYYFDGDDLDPQSLEDMEDEGDAQHHRKRQQQQQHEHEQKATEKKKKKNNNKATDHHDHPH